MAVINKMRKSGWVFVVILAALALFVLSDFIGTFQRGGTVGEPTVGVFNGHKVKYSEFNEAVKNREQALAQQSGNDPNASGRDQASNDAWDDMFRKYIVNEEYKKLGITASNSELSESLFSDDPHPYIKQYFADENGEFSSANVRNWYEQVYKTSGEAQVFFNSLKDAIISSIQGDKYTDMILKGIHTTNFDVMTEYMQQSKTFSGSVVGLQTTAISNDEVNYTEEELKSYYNKHKSKFKLNASRDIEYVSWAITPSYYDSTEVSEDLEREIENFKNADNDSLFAAMLSDRAVYDSYRPLGMFPAQLNNPLSTAQKGDVLGPMAIDGAFLLAKVHDVREGVNAKYRYNSIQIPNSWSDKADSLEKVEEARELLEKMQTQPFDELAKQLQSENKAYFFEGNHNGDEPWMEQSQMNPDIVSFVTNGNKGDKTIISTPRGIFAVVIEANPNNNEYMVYEVVKEVEPSMNSINEAYTRANIFRSSLKNGENNEFDRALEESGFAKRIAKDISSSDKNIPGIDNAGDIVKWIFEEDRKLHEISEPFTTDDKQVVVHLSKITKEGIGSFDDVRELVIEQILKEKKLNLIVDKLEKATANQDNMVQIAIELGTVAHDFSNTAFKSNSFSAAKDDYIVLGAVSGIGKDKVSQPIRGIKGAYVVLVTEIINPELPLPDELNDRKALVFNNATQNIESKIVNSLKAMSKIEDNRNKYY